MSLTSPVPLFAKLAKSTARSAGMARCAVWLLAPVLLVVLSPLSQAQDAGAPDDASSASIAKPQTDREKRETFFREQYDPLVKTDPAAAMKMGREFLAANPQLKAFDLIRVYDRMAYSLYRYGLKTQKAENTATALALLDEGMQEVAASETPAKAADLNRVALFTKLDILVGEKRIDEAVPLLQENWEAAVWDDSLVTRAFDLARKLSGQQGRPQEATALMEKALSTRLLARRQVEVPLFKGLITSLSEQKRYDEALSYARLLFGLCAYNEEAMQEAAKLLASVWVAQGKAESIGTFAQAQQDATAANPLQEVALPQMPAEVFKKELPRAQAFAAKSRNSPARLGELVTLLLAQGQYRSAMEVAQQLWLADIQKAAGVEEIARVFKAADNNLVRVNRFLAYAKARREGVQEPEGGDPLREFFAQHPAQPQGVAPQEGQ